MRLLDASNVEVAGRKYRLPTLNVRRDAVRSEGTNLNFRVAEYPLAGRKSKARAPHWGKFTTAARGILDIYVRG